MDFFQRESFTDLGLNLKHLRSVLKSGRNEDLTPLTTVSSPFPGCQFTPGFNLLMSLEMLRHLPGLQADCIHELALVDWQRLSTAQVRLSKVPSWLYQREYICLPGAGSGALVGWMVVPQKHMSPRTCACNFTWKRDLEMRSSCIWMGPKINGKCP